MRSLPSPRPLLCWLIVLAAAVACSGAPQAVPSTSTAAAASTSTRSDTPPPTTLPTVASAVATRRPNILLVIADDMGVDSSPCHPGVGRLKPAMPTLSSLCQNGVVFDNAWVNPECSPTRASMLTGRYGFRTNVGAANDAIGLSEQTIQALMDARAPGRYSHAVIGKWHLANAANGGAANPNRMGVGYYAGDWNGIVEDFFNYDRYVNGVAAPLPGYVTSIEVDDAIAWYQTQTTPWFLWLALNAPHTPLHLPPAGLHAHPGLTGSAQDIAAHPIEYQQADLEALDHELGRLVGSMNATTRANTTVIFMGDNGTASLAVQPPIKADRAKTTVYQGGVTVPFVVSGVGVTRVSQREAALINGVDMFATVADLTGLGLQDANDGRSFGPLLSSASGPHRDFAYTEYFVGSTRASGAGPAGGGPGGDAAGRRAAASGWAIRDDRYKLIELQTSGRQLYDLVNDPWETRDLLLTPTADALAKAESLAAVALTLRSSSVTVR